MAKLFSRSIQMQSQHSLEKDLVAPAQILNINSRNRAVGDRQQRSLFGSHTRGSQPDILDRPRAVAEFANISHPNHFIAQHRNAAKQIRDRLLRSEADRQSSNAN